MATFDVQVHAKFDGSTWTNISGDVQYEDKVNIQYGAGNQGSQVDRGSCTFRLLNTNGDYTPGNPVGAYYPNIGLNTKIRASVKQGDVGMLLAEDSSGGVSTPDAAAIDITGDLDVRVEASLWNWGVRAESDTATSTVELIGKYDGSPNRSWFLGTRDGYLYFEWSSTGSNVLSATSTEQLRVPGSNPRMAVRVTLDVNNGAGGNTVTFYRSGSITGVWEQVGSAVVQAGATSIANTTAALKIGDATSFVFALPLGVFHKAEVRNGIGGTVVANPDFTAQTDGTTSFADAAGLTWTAFGDAEITNRKIRFSGEVASWEPRRKDKTFKYVDVQANGILRRLTSVDEVFQSSMYRDMTSPSRANIVAYWPMESGTDATQYTSPLDGVEPMTITPSGVDVGSYSLWAASSDLPTFSTGFVWGETPPYTVTGETSIRCFIAVPSGGVSATQQIVSIPNSGTARQWRLIIDSSGNLDLRAYDYTNTQILSTGAIGFALNGLQRMLTLEFVQNGADIDWVIITTAVDTLTQSSFSGTLAGYTFGRVSGVKLGGGGDFGGGAMGQLSVADSADAYTGSGSSIANWKGERTDLRMIRLGKEEDIPISVSGAAPGLQGGQGETDVVTLLRDAASADQGVLAESRDRLGFLYRPPDSMSSQTPILSLTYTDGARAPIVEPFEPVYDDDVLINDFTAKRRDGGQTRAQETTGRLSVSDPPSGVGRVVREDSFNVFYDHQTGDIAGWTVHIGTFEGGRFARLRVRLDKKTALISDFCRAYVGDVIEISEVPLDLAGTSLIKLKIEGYTEEIDQFEWVINYVMSPAEPWDVGVASYDSTAFQEEQFTWADTEASELVEALTTTETDIDVLTTAGPQWTSDPTDTPYDLEFGGEIARCTAPGGLVNSNPLFATDVTGWTAVGSTIAFDSTTVMPHPCAAGSLKVTPDGVTAAVGARSTHTAVGTINPGGSYVASGWFFSATASSDMRVVIDWYDSADVLLSSSLGSASSLGASTWTYLSQTLTAPASASRAAVRVYRGGTPAASAVTYCWAVRITRLKASTVFDNFGRTDTDTWTNADSSQTWTNSGGAAADYDVLSGYGRHINPAVSTAHRSVIAAPDPDFDIYCDITTAALATGGSLFAGPVTRYTDDNNLYQARLEFTTTNTIILSIRKRVASVETELGTFTSALTHVAATFVRVRFQGYGSTLKAKVWAIGAEEPQDWKVTVTDSALTGAGSLGVRSVRNSTNTNANAEFRFDNFDLITPQTFIVERSVNGVVKAQSSGEAVALAHPAIAALGG